MTKPDHSVATARVKSADKMVMLPPLFDGTKPEVAKQHYKRFNQYIKFQTKSGNIRDPVVHLTTLKTMFLQRYNAWGKTKRDQLQSWNILTFDPQKMDVDEHIDLIDTLGDMLGQKDESKKDRFIDTMPTIYKCTLLLKKIGQQQLRKPKN